MCGAEAPTDGHGQARAQLTAAEAEAEARGHRDARAQGGREGGGEGGRFDCAAHLFEALSLGGSGCVPRGCGAALDLAGCGVLHALQLDGGEHALLERVAHQPLDALHLRRRKDGHVPHAARRCAVAEQGLIRLCVSGSIVRRGRRERTRADTRMQPPPVPGCGPHARLSVAAGAGGGGSHPAALLRGPPRRLVGGAMLLRGDSLGVHVREVGRSRTESR